MSNLARAIAIAAEAHDGQFDKAGQPYILHPLRVMLAQVDEDSRIVGVLHDVVEDCQEKGWTFERLRREGFSSCVLEALDAVTKRVEGDEPYADFAMRAASNSIGRRVKLADLHDNCDLSRIAKPQQRDYDRIARYRAAIEAITSNSKLDPPLARDDDKQSLTDDEDFEYMSIMRHGPEQGG